MNEIDRIEQYKRYEAGLAAVIRKAAADGKKLTSTGIFDRSLFLFDLAEGNADAKQALSENELVLRYAIEHAFAGIDAEYVAEHSHYLRYARNGVGEVRKLQPLAPGASKTSDFQAGVKIGLRLKNLSWDVQGPGSYRVTL